MSYPQRGQITTSMQCYLYAYVDNVFYTATLIAVEGQSLKSLVFDPRVGSAACFASFSFNNFSQRMVLRTAASSIQSNVGYVGGVLDVTEIASDIVPITTAANDDYFNTLGITSLVSIPYNFFYNNRMVPFYSYISDGAGGIKVDTNGNPLKQVIYGPIYFYTITWFPLSNCSVTLSDQATINGIVRTWLTTGVMPTTRYFTESGDCTTAVEYQYCPFRDICTITCNGPCITADQTCTYNKSEEAFYCAGGSNPDPTVTQDTTVIWFLLIVILIFVVVTILAILYA